jgi:predicted transcriptional regulator
MRFDEFREMVRNELVASGGLTWEELRARLGLKRTRACPEWTKRLEEEIGLVREPGEGRAFVWRVNPKS